ncbi:STAS domain-containing protein [uncultured Tateyamaria sp.]|uniref:STAS domain-containing protein n=1 Tax=uncultured Tateyamaria sp. TaxID=455651 RepID=UPI00260C273A|nr:STAS domain-containing protein [uncultured Tateyamaria sp.]
MLDAIPLPARLDAATAPKLAAVLCNHVDSRDLDLDARHTTHVGAMGVQVLLSAQHTAHAKGRRFRLLNLQERARDHIRLMGLSELMMLEDE